MIKNERQYKVTKSRIAEFNKAIEAVSQEARPTTIEPLIWEAQKAALTSQRDDLMDELREYEELTASRPAVIEVGSLDGIADALIMARIALKLTQRDLADRMGLKEQQIQRYEATDYATATLSRITEVAQALGVRIAESVFLPQAALTPKGLIQKIAEAGIDGDFLLDRLLPSDVADSFLSVKGDEVSTVALQAAKFLERIYGWLPDDLCDVGELPLPEAAVATARFKVPKGRQGRALGAYIAYAHYLALVVANASGHVPKNKASADPDGVRKALLAYGDGIRLESVLAFLWDSGIPVLPLSDKGQFHGACWRVEGRNVIVAKQRSSHASRWAFDLLHEFYHACQNPDDTSHSWIEDFDPIDGAIDSSEEQAANIFAGNVLLGGRAEELVSLCVKEAQGNVRYLKAVVPKVAHREGVGTDHLANYLAFRLSLQGMNWWGTACALQEPGEPFSVAREFFLERFNFHNVTDVDARLIRRALDGAGD